MDIFEKINKLAPPNSMFSDRKKTYDWKKRGECTQTQSQSAAREKKKKMFKNVSAGLSFNGCEWRNYDVAVDIILELDWNDDEVLYFNYF